MFLFCFFLNSNSKQHNILTENRTSKLITVNCSVQADLLSQNKISSKLAVWWYGRFKIQILIIELPTSDEGFVF